MDRPAAASPTILLVGHCAADFAALQRWLEKHFQAVVASCDSISQALSRVQSGGVDLLLINRVFEFTGEQGQELLRQLPRQNGSSRVEAMLISNFPEAQKAAVEIGARPGFGKSQLHSTEALAALRAALPVI